MGSLHASQAASRPGDTVRDVVDEFLEAARAGEAMNSRQRPYENTELRDLRWSLRGYVASELGTMRIAELRGAELRAFVGRLDAGGLSQTRTRAVIRALRALLRYAAQRGMIAWSAADPLVFGDTDELPEAAPPVATAPQAAPASAHRVPDEVIWLTLKIVTVVFALIALVLIAESV